MKSKQRIGTQDELSLQFGELRQACADIDIDVRARCGPVRQIQVQLIMPLLGRVQVLK